MKKTLIYFLQIFFIISCETGGGGGGSAPVNDKNLTATFLVDKRSYSVNEEIQFHNISEGEGELSYYWNFGDNTNSKEKNPTHFYSKRGEYFPTLTISENGQYDTYKFKILIVEEPSIPTSEIVLSDTLIKLGETLDFRTNQPDEVEWNLDENFMQTGISGNVTYSRPGKKTISVKSADGNTIFEQNVQVYSASVTPGKISKGQSISMKFVGDFEVKWLLPEGTILSEKNVSAKINSTGNQSIKIYDASGSVLIDSFMINVEEQQVKAPPTAPSTRVSSADIDKLLIQLSDPSLTMKSKDNVATELEKHFASGESAKVTGQYEGDLYELITKLRIESSPYIKVSIKTRLQYNSSGKISKIEITDYQKDEL